MRTIRVSIAGLMGTVGFFALGIAALKKASPLWSSAIFTAALALLCTMSVLAIARTGRRRITWGGAALFGWVYLVSAFGVGPPASPPVVTKPLMAAAFPHVYTSDVLSKSALQGDISWIPAISSRLSMPVIYVDSYLQIGHSLGAIAFALLGGVVARFLAARDDEAGGPRPPTGSP